METQLFFYTLLSVLLVSFISIVGLITFLLKETTLEKVIPYLVSFSAGGLIGNVFLHLIPEAAEGKGLTTVVSLTIILGICVSFVLERFLQWRHCHIPTSKKHPHSFAYMNLFGDAVHNFIDGMIIGGSFLINTSLGMTTTLAVALHEIPQEIGDCGVLLHGGFKRSKALLFNLLTALTAIIGAITSLNLGSLTQESTKILVPFAAGQFIYIAGSDLIPELRKDEPHFRESAIQLLAFAIGIFLMLLVKIL